MMYYTAMAAEQARGSGGRWVSGHILGNSKGGFEFEGFNQPLRAGRNREGMQARYVVLDYSGIGTSLYSTHALEAAHTSGNTGGLKYLGRSIHFAGSTPYTDSGCWFSPYFACNGGKYAGSVATGNNSAASISNFGSFSSITIFIFSCPLPAGIDSVTLLFLLLVVTGVVGFGINFFISFKCVQD